MSNVVKLGLKKNWKQFSLLILINAFVGGMAGLERTILPALAEEEFGLSTNTIILTFIVIFGVSKALANYLMGKLAQKRGRKKLLVIGWLFGLPVPFMIMFATNWNYILAANILLGINQGFAWSATVIMKIDLVGEKQRGLAMGINEFAGYVAVGIVAFLTGYIASNYGLRPYPFYLGISIAVLGLLGSVLLIRDTHQHVAVESKESTIVRLANVFIDTSVRHPNLGSVSQAGLVNNLNDGMIWGLLPIFLAAKDFNLEQIGIIAAVYPAVWGIGQLFTGGMADRMSKKKLLFWGMIFQGVAIIGFAGISSYVLFILTAALLGLGTAMVYPTFLAAIADNIHPGQRAEGIGVFRLWRDLGYAVGAILTGIIADLYSYNTAIVFIAVLTFLSAVIILVRMRN